MSYLSVAGLIKRYQSRTVVRGVSFEVHNNEVLGLLGPNGAGKTTCFYMVVGLVGVDEGKILMNDRDITHDPMHKRALAGLSYLPQEPSIFRKLSVTENIQAVLELQGFSGKSLESRLLGLLDDLGIRSIASSNAVSLSGGERRRVEIARALASNPKFILLDEPFAGVDPIAVSDIKSIVRLLRDKKVGVLITDHNVRYTLDICDRVCIINEGEVLASGTPRDIVNNQKVKEVYLGEDFYFESSSTTI